ncbi:recombination regulator RecX [Clostridium sp.]|uniref:recombination regulator RecX n=1 Tax=Clostridium sp. TaxID=1506 RepID=UPI00262495C9|nr:recombination regulator RecX [Clostridium sp.]
MSKVTKMEIQKRNKERVNLFLDGEYAFSISDELVYTEGLKLNNDIDSDKLKALAEKDSLVRCKEAGLRIIERTYKTEKELREKLKLKGYEDNAVDYCIDFLKKYNYINDTNYSKAFINDKLNSMGSQKIRYALIQKGISREIIDEELTNLSTENEENVAFNIGKKKYNAIIKNETDEYKISGKLYRYLISKGYSIDITNSVVKEIMSFESYE